MQHENINTYFAVIYLFANFRLGGFIFNINVSIYYSILISLIKQILFVHIRRMRGLLKKLSTWHELMKIRLILSLI